MPTSCTSSEVLPPTHMTDCSLSGAHDPPGWQKEENSPKSKRALSQVCLAADKNLSFLSPFHIHGPLIFFFFPEAESTFCFQMYRSRDCSLKLISSLPTHLIGSQREAVTAPPSRRRAVISPVSLSGGNISIFWALYRIYDSHGRFVA